MIHAANLGPNGCVPWEHVQWLRQRSDHRWQRRMQRRLWGISSDALAWYAVMGSEEPTEDVYPSDPSDLAACERMYRTAPEDLKGRMVPVMSKYRHYVQRKYPGAIEAVQEEVTYEQNNGWLQPASEEPRTVEVRAR